jgi:hypothetical protein
VTNAASSASSFEGDALERLKLAAEDIAFLTGRGYPALEVKPFVAKHRALSPEEQALLERAVCSEAQYKKRAVKEMLPEDISRRPLFVDGHDIVDTVATALAGGLLLESVDQTFQPVSLGGAHAENVSAHVDAALERIGPVLREMRPSKTTWLLAAARVDAAALSEKLGAVAKKWKVLVEVQVVAEPKVALGKLANVATSDPKLIDECKSWCNLAGPVVATIAGAKRIKLQ